MYKKILLLCLAMYFVSADSYGQSMFRAYNRYMRASSKGKKLYQRDYLGYGKAFMTIDVKQHYTDIRYVDPDPNTNYSTNSKGADTFIHTKYTAASAISYTEGTFFPLQKVGKEGLIALDVSATVNLLQYNIGPIDYSSTTGIVEGGITEQFYFPIGLVYKYGGEVNLNKKSKFLFTAGCGFAPYVSGSKIIAFSSLMAGSRKYVMAEFGVFGGIAWKLRTTIYFGNIVLVDNRYADIFDATSGHSDGYGNLDIKVTGGTTATVSLLINPFSWDWRGKGNNYSPINKEQL